jgi:putative membrane protein
MHMQDPFENRPTDTAMTTIATNIHRNIAQMIDEADKAPARHPANAFYAM